EKIKKFFDKKEIAVLGLAFKAGTDDVRMSPAIEIIKYLLADDFKIFAYDPKAMENTQKILGDKIIYCQNLAQCFEKSQNIVILTEWQEFKQIKDFPEFDNKQILDLRYIL
ncbi:MAG: UDP binding domain-containing protein, partial [Alphaproteobacteria bacterium]